ncbi:MULTISPECIES: protein TolQ [Azospirillaceae]|uniref:protein TolQ n=1 Tax=Azospirillaceae TaxID=2829815 RepID=UPI000B70E270|nr:MULTISPECIES: protein TolQ [Azospirillaceae]MDG5494237.1 protein TolQ [Niveispirillum sp. BGYR6]SNR98918.1 Cell division and transport-associated protein TolQ [Azospirillum sp. RU38E]SNS16286.1 Cell division and transport-associated protein TolQ [Azospirillum sp. RU37A]
MYPTLLQAAPLGGAVPAHELTAWGLFMQADPVVKLVMLGLVFASVWTWAIVYDKVKKLRRIKAAAADFEEQFWSGGSLDQLYDQVSANPADPLSAVFAAGMREWRHATERGLTSTGAMRANLAQRIERVMSVTVNREMANTERYLTVLASVGSAGPFVGLFGTVWGIMGAFTNIAAQQNTSLAVVAPGIAEALFATAIGLVAAIPAVLAYNYFSSEIGRFGDRLDSFVTEFSAILQRHLEERG